MAEDEEINPFKWREFDRAEQRARDRSQMHWTPTVGRLLILAIILASGCTVLEYIENSPIKVPNFSSPNVPDQPSQPTQPSNGDPFITPIGGPWHCQPGQWGCGEAPGGSNAEVVLFVPPTSPSDADTPKMGIQ